MLKCDKDSIADIIEDMVLDFIDSGHMNKENKELVKRTLLSHHRHNSIYNSSGLIRKKSTISEFFPLGSRRQSTFTNAFNSENTSTSNSRKNSSVQWSDLNINKAKNKKMSISEINLQNEVEEQKNSDKIEKIRLIFSILKKNSNQFQKNQISQNNRENSVKFFEPSHHSIDNHCSSVENSLNANHQRHRRRSTIAMLKNSLTQTKLNKVS